MHENDTYNGYVPKYDGYVPKTSMMAMCPSMHGYVPIYAYLMNDMNDMNMICYEWHGHDMLWMTWIWYAMNDTNRLWNDKDMIWHVFYFEWLVPKGWAPYAPLGRITGLVKGGLLTCP